ncbi:MAG: hypothetical protein E7525_03600 [Ruminococcaceae bacterium]|nr:hypothetical protein [Oscillospiraceae bacterium]
MSKFHKMLIASGHCDKRGAAFCATANKLPRGEYGMVALCIKDNMLNLYDVDIRRNIGTLLYQIKLSDVKRLKAHRFFLCRSLWFVYQGYEYSFNHLIAARRSLKVIQEEYNKQFSK